MSKLQKTEDFTIFKNVLGNREINERHVRDLTDAIRRKNLLEYYPLLVNEDKEVIDGQHRLLAAANAGVPVYYTEVPGLQLDDVMSINTHSKRWGIQDFVDSYITLGNHHYEVLNSFAKNHHLSVGASAQLLAGNYNRSNVVGGGTIGSMIKNGSFEVLAQVQAERIARALDDIQPYANFNVKIDRNFIQALRLLDRNPVFDMEKLMSKLQIHGDRKIERRVNPRYYLLQLEEIYNFKASTGRVELYASSQQAV